MKTLFKTVLRYVTRNNTTTVEPPNNGQIGSMTFVLYREVVPFRVVETYLIQYSILHSLKHAIHGQKSKFNLQLEFLREMSAH